jgi:hypothetical protein
VFREDAAFGDEITYVATPFCTGAETVVIGVICKDGMIPKVTEPPLTTPAVLVTVALKVYCSVGL